MRHALVLGLAAAVAAAGPWTLASAQMEDPVAAEFDKFREVLEKDNPAELWEVKGEQLWKSPGGPESPRRASISRATSWCAVRCAPRMRAI